MRTLPDPVEGRLILHKKDFKFIEEDLLPVLVLGVSPCFGSSEPDKSEEWFYFKNPDDWRPIAHQTAGHACHHHYMIGRVLKPRNGDVERNMDRLSRKWLDSCAGMSGVGLDTVLEYRADLERLFQVDCKWTYPDFEEGLAPIDIEGLKKMTSEDLPEKLDDLIVFDDDKWRIYGCIGRWRLWILMNNCD